MAILLKITEGPGMGETFNLFDGLVIGRSGATINISDPKVSSRHALIRHSEGEVQWVLEDNNSKNGVRDAAGHRVSRLELNPGAVFELGPCKFAVIREESIDQGPPAGIKAELTGVTKVSPPPPKKRQVLWHDALAEFLEKQAKKFKDRPKDFEPLIPSLVLDFVRGPQVNWRWTLGYGPRKIGPSQLDLPIWEPEAPDVCFEISPTADGLLFHTEYPEKVHLNGQKVDSQLLRMGDTIEIGETLIEVDFGE